MTQDSAPDAQEMPNQGRRNWLIGTVAGVAALVGAGLAWRNDRRSAGADSELWRLKFENMQGGEFSMSTLRGNPLLLNFWATWCPPCIEELPLLSSFYRENVSKGWQILGLAVDQRLPVRQFLSRTPLPFPVALAGTSGIELSRSLGNTAGGLPFTVVIGSDGNVMQRKIGPMSADDLRALARI